jgi:hypothetical protein
MRSPQRLNCLQKSLQLRGPSQFPLGGRSFSSDIPCFGIIGLQPLKRVFPAFFLSG